MRFKKLFDKLKAAPPEQRKKADNFYTKSTSGTEVFSGFFAEEYLTEIRGKQWADKVDEMRRSSDQIATLLRLISIPIISGVWTVDFAEDTPEKKEIKEFIEFSLFESINWKEHLEEALSNFAFGYSLFEPVFFPLLNHPKFGDKITLKKMAWISPRTVEEWNLNHDGSINNVRQQADGDLDVDVNIPGSHLVVFPIGKEGDNYEGFSLLRPIYGNWLRKQHALKQEAIGLERTSLGVLVGTMPRNTDEQSEKNFSDALESITTHESNYITVTEGYVASSLKIDFDGAALDAAIRREDLGMARAFLAAFMELGNSGGTGSFALSTNLMNIFFNNIQIYADKIAETWNRTNIKTLVDVNYGRQADYPKLIAGGISDKIGKEFVEMLAVLTDKGYIEPTDDLKEFLMKKFNLPEAELQEKKEETEDPTTPPTQLSLFTNNAPEDGLQLAATPSPIKLIKSTTKTLEDFMIEDLTKNRDKLLERIKKILDNNKGRSRRKLVVSQKIPGLIPYKETILDVLLETSAIATNQAVTEVGGQEIKLDKENIKKNKSKVTPQTTDRITTEVNLIGDTQYSDLEKTLYFTFNNNIDNTDSTEQIIKDMRESSDRFIEGAPVKTGAANFASNAVNNARNDVFQTDEVFEEMESFTITNPNPKAAICIELAGRTITKEEYKTGDLPPYHHQCNTIVVANVKGGKSNPSVSPLGLQFTGTEAQVEKIIKSNTL